MGVILGIALSNAKITVAMVDMKYRDASAVFDSIVHLSVAKNNVKITQAMIAVHGEEWYKEHFIKVKPFSMMFLNIGKDNEIIISFRNNNDKSLLLDIKKALDYMALNNDTVYIINQIFKNSYTNIIHQPRSSLIVGKMDSDEDEKLFIRDMNPIGRYCYPLDSLYMQCQEECKEKGYRSTGEEWSSEAVELFYNN